MGPLRGVKILEMAGLGAAPFAAMMLADMGAEVIRIDRAEAKGGSRADILNRGRRSVALNLKNPMAVAAVLKMVKGCDALIEGFRPGVMERLGLGPAECAQHNPRLVYGRMTGWGQEGPLANSAGHDINYISLTGALYAIGPREGKPVPPLNLVGDYGGGMMMAFGLVTAILEARSSCRGQVVDAAMMDAAALTMNRFLGLYAEGRWNLARGSNFLDGGAPFYDTYVCADGKSIAIGPIEPQFHAELLARLGLEPMDSVRQMDQAHWPADKARMAALFLTRGRDEWCRLLEDGDACFSPVLSLDEAPSHPHNQARQTFIDIDGITQAAPAPRFSRTIAEVSLPPPTPGEHSAEVLADWGFSALEIAELI